MDKIFALNTEPYVNKQKIFAKNTVTIHEGLTVLVGCNGSGKTSMLKLICNAMPIQYFLPGGDGQ